MSPQFAVMINAPWGTGKTFFITQYIKKYENESSNKSKFLNISLYGLSSIGEIDDAIFQKLHPRLSSQNTVLAAKFGQSFLKSTLRFDWPFKKDDFQHLLKQSQELILVFDDLERCNLDTNKLLGYINQFNEHQNHKIILIANEEQITKKDTSYQQIKEKLIGKTFLLMSDHESAISTFINQTKCTQTKKILSASKTLILEFIQRYKNHNLRIIQQIFYDFERLVQTVENKFIDNQHFISKLLESFLIICYEHRQGHLEINQLSIDYIVSNEIEKHPLKKYGLSDFSLDIINILSNNIWEEILDKSYFNQLQINEYIGKTEYFTVEPLWVKLWNYRSHSDEKLLNLLEQIKADVKNQKIDSAWVILHLWGIFLTYNQVFKIISDNELSILRIQLLGNAQNLKNPFPNYPHSLLNTNIIQILDNSYNGYFYQSHTEPQFQDFLKDLETALLAHLKKIIQNRVDEISELLKTNPNELATQLAYENGENFITSHVLIQVDTKKLVAEYNQLDGSQQFEINSGLHSRYKNRIQSYLEEVNWLHSLTCEFDTLKQTLEASPSQVNNLKLYRLNLINDELKGIVLEMKKN